MAEHTVKEVTAKQYFTYERFGVTSAAVLPSQPCRMVWFKAASGNPTNVYLGKSTVTVLNGTANTATTGMELDAGDMWGPIPLTNLNQLYMLCDSTDDDLIIWGY